MADSKPYISNVNCVMSFALDKEIRYLVKDIEKAFQTVISGEAKGTNVADAMPPPIPRFTLQSGSKQISISQVQAQLTLAFERDNKALEETFAIVNKNISLFWDGVCKLKKPIDRKELGVVVTINCPSDLTSSEVAKAIYDRYAKLPPMGDIVSSGIQMGFLLPEFNFFRNVAIGGYEIRKGIFEGQLGQLAGIEIDSLETTEGGFEVKMDVNTRPRVKKGVEVTDDTGHLVFRQLENFLFEDGKQFLEW